MLRRLAKSLPLSFAIGGLYCLFLAGCVEQPSGQAAEANAQAAEAPDAVNRYPGFTGYARHVTTASEDAQALFNQGIQLLYGFNHDEAIRSFEQAAEIDPSCAMAWWGSAYARGLHINNPEMTEEQSRLANEAAGKAVAALDDETPVEQSLVRAVRRRYAWPAPEDRMPLDLAYAEAMEAVWHDFPDDPDVGALFAESLMNLQPWDLWTDDGAPKGRTLEIVAVLERTLAKTLRHPGANHFYIHAIEASPWPERGLASAERLQALVPGSGHLVHMPSHIFIRTGRYADAAESNEEAIQADEAYFALAPPPEFYSLYFMHNIHFLAYAAMMEGRYQSAIDAARKIEATIPPEFLKEYVTIADGFMPTSLYVLMRFGKWEEILAEPEPEAWRPFSRAERHFARSVAFSALGKTAEAHRELELMDDAAAALTDEWKMGNNPAIDVIAVARKMAEGELAFREGRRDGAFQLLREAVELEENLAYDEPPGWMQPVRHALGALLLADGRYAEAEETYRADLERHPNNAWSLLGLQQSLEKQQRSSDAAAIAERVRQAWARADVTPVASCYCHPDARAVRTDAGPREED
jgi:tetratricopeptide (TPR) repeat protein